MEYYSLNTEENVKPLSTMDKILSISQPLVLPIAIANFIVNGGWFYGIVLAIIAGGAILYPAKRIINAIKRRNIHKLNCFLDYQQELNENVGNNENMLLNGSRKTISQIKVQQDEEKLNSEQEICEDVVISEEELKGFEFNKEIDYFEQIVALRQEREYLASLNAMIQNDVIKEIDKRIEILEQEARQNGIDDLYLKREKIQENYTFPRK